MDPSTCTESARIRSAIEAFMLERLQPKLDKLKPEDIQARQTQIEAHQPENWLADAARRVKQIQQATHILKFTHPSAKGTNLNSQGNPSADPLELATHSLGKDFAVDVVGNAAALDVYKFLSITVDGRNLLERAINKELALIQALSDDESIAKEWVQAFADFAQSTERTASHTLAKQVYWPIDDGYHMLAPLFSSPLSQALRQRVFDDRFSDAAKAARQAQRTGQYTPHGYREYPNLAIQTFGGSKPQNISQLNSERRGENLLLASLPPHWESPALRPPLRVETIFQSYYPYRREVRRLTSVLKNYLRSMAKRRSTMHIRYTRASLVSELVDELLNMTAELHRALEPGWSAQPACRLRLAEQRWLDPQRLFMDEDFAARLAGQNWEDEICRGFANWLNGALRTDKTLFGEDESREWESALKQEIKLLREELADD